MNRTHLVYEAVPDDDRIPAKGRREAVAVVVGARDDADAVNRAQHALRLRFPEEVDRWILEASLVEPGTVLL